jgi:hypothetical protein
MIGFILGTASRTKISATCARNAALNTAQSRHMLANKVPRVGLLIDLSDVRVPEIRNEIRSGAFVPVKRRKGGVSQQHCE